MICLPQRRPKVEQARDLDAIGRGRGHDEGLLRLLQLALAGLELNPQKAQREAKLR